MSWPKKWELWEIVEEFVRDKRKMLRIKCPDCGWTCTIRRTKYRDPRTCNVCRFTAQNRANFGKHHGCGDLTRTFYNYFRQTAKRRGIDWGVSVEYLWELAEKQGQKCALSGLPIVFPTVLNHGAPTMDTNESMLIATGSGQVQAASLDRKDSNKGYVEGNVQWVNKYVNLMKNGLSQDEFIHLCHMIAGQHADPKVDALEWFPYGQDRVRKS